MVIEDSNLEGRLVVSPCAETVFLGSKSHASIREELQHMVNFVFPSAEPPIAHLKPIRHGAFSHIFTGRLLLPDNRLGEKVAVKVMRYPTHESDSCSWAVELFRREAMIHRELSDHSACQNSGKVVPVLRGSGEIANFYETRKGLKALHYLAMDYIDSVDVRAMLYDPCTPASSKLEFFARVTEPLEKFHAAGYVHNDVKPENLAYSPGTGQAVLLDLGLARPIGSVCSNEFIVGTVEYMAPEQIHNLPVDPRTDIFAVGVMLYETFNYGAMPFSGLQRYNLPPPFVSPKSIILGIDEIAFKCIKADPDRRYQSMGELRKAICERIV